MTQKRNTRKKFNIKKLIKNILKLSIILLTIYVVKNRIAEIDGLSWFFTTWN